jgi:hypothetical protein
MNWFSRTPEPIAPILVDRIRPVEVPVITESKLLLGRQDLSGALLYAYPRVVEDLARAYRLELPPGFSHEEIVMRKLSGPLGPIAEFFDRLYRLYAPVRYGSRLTSAGADEILGLLQSLYSTEPMWRLYVTPNPPTSHPRGSTFEHVASTRSGARS